MKFGIVVFPGSNCDHDAYSAVKLIDGVKAEYIWHKDTNIPKDIDTIILPGGFSYGDYLRSGAIAKFSPIMNEVKRFADKGGYVIGICNGFQVLTESHILPGALLRNNNLNFICKDVFLKTINKETHFTSEIEDSKILRIPIANGEGNYYAEPDIIMHLEDTDRIAFKYCNESGEIKDDANPNGSVNNIAGILNENKNVLGMMPHPERYSDKTLGYDDGIVIFKSILKFFNS
jgi:phosphoribosylformylglycinamidine synthase I